MLAALPKAVGLCGFLLAPYALTYATGRVGR
jgi:hypothetical protein